MGEEGFEIAPPVIIKRIGFKCFSSEKKLFSSSKRRVKFVVIAYKNSQLNTLVQNEVGLNDKGEEEDIFVRK